MVDMLFLGYSVVSSFISYHYHIIVWMNVYVSGNSDRTVKDSTVCPFIIWIRVSNMCVCSATLHSHIQG